MYKIKEYFSQESLLDKCVRIDSIPIDSYISYKFNMYLNI